MTRDEQRHFVHELSATIAEEIVKQIDDGKVPSEWNGIELRWLLSERHKQSAAMCSGYDESKRKRKFSNTVLVNNL